MISFSKVATPWLDGRHVVFGKVTAGFDEVVKPIEALDGTPPRKKVVIVASGGNKVGEPEAKSEF